MAMPCRTCDLLFSTTIHFGPACVRHVWPYSAIRVHGGSEVR